VSLDGSVLDRFNAYKVHFCVMALSWLAVSISGADTLTADRNDVGATWTFCFAKVGGRRETQKNVLQKQ
jgi:hypothetical protein